MSRDGWKTITLQEAGVSLIDCEHKTPPAQETGHPYVTIPQLKNGRIDLTGVRLIAREDLTTWTRKAKPQEHDVVLSRRCNPGETAFVPLDLEFALGQNLVLLRANGKKLFPPFLRWLVRGPGWWEQIMKYLNAGAVFDSLKCADIPNFELSIPDLSTQTRIAAILSALDDKIELNRQTNATLEAIAQAIFKEWFVNFRYPGSTGEMQASELGPIPKGWEVKPLGEITNIKHGFAFKGEYFSEEETDEILITPGNFRIGGGFNYSKFKYYDGPYPSEYLLTHGDFIVTMTDLSKQGDTLGYPALVPQISGKNILHNQRIGKVEVKDRLMKLYLYFVMQQHDYRNHVLGGATGTTVKHTSPGRISEYMIVIPNGKILKKFQDIAQPLIDRIEYMFLQNQILAQTRDTLLPKLMSGEIEV